ncbi:hypothetical protein M9H77_19150 [Catharanthus roseus]|uniref:Uncharacterized protein n=1 Tax=Catharanthus roseus TaxID=4058 RepID=A0ACC0B9K7_CATRO|nr:hypothetical protein M9H77_19150 [Catharanthus roseus]
MNRTLTQKINTTYSVTADRTTPKQIYEIDSNEQKLLRKTREQSRVDLKPSGSRTVALTIVALIPLRSRTSSASSNRKNPSANRWPQRRKLSVSLSKNALSSHCSHIHGNPKVSRHRRASGSPERSHRKTNRQTARRKRERRQKVKEQEAAAAQHRVKNERIRAAEENKMFI